MSSTSFTTYSHVEFLYMLVELFFIIYLFV